MTRLATGRVCILSLQHKTRAATGIIKSATDNKISYLDYFKYATQNTISYWDILKYATHKISYGYFLKSATQTKLRIPLDIPENMQT